MFLAVIYLVAGPQGETSEKNLTETIPVSATDSLSPEFNSSEVLEFAVIDSFTRDMLESKFKQLGDASILDLERREIAKDLISYFQKSDVQINILSNEINSYQELPDFLDHLIIIPGQQISVLDGAVDSTGKIMSLNVKEF